MTWMILVGLIGLPGVGLAQVRTWTDATGEFSTEAELVRIDDGKVILKRTDGNFATVPIERLGETDRRFLKLPAKLRPLVIAGEQKRAQQIAKIEEELRQAEADLLLIKHGRVMTRSRLKEPRLKRPVKGDPYWEFPNGRSKQQLLEKEEKKLPPIEKRLDEAKRERRFELPILPLFSCKLGQIGIAPPGPGCEFEVLQVVGEDQILATFCYRWQEQVRLPAVEAGTQEYFDAIAASERNLDLLKRGLLQPLGMRTRRSELFWINGIPTAGLADASKIRTRDAFEVTGTKQYVTALGSTKMVLVLERIDLSEFHAAEQRRKEQKETKEN